MKIEENMENYNIRKQMAGTIVKTYIKGIAELTNGNNIKLINKQRELQKRH